MFVRKDQIKTMDEYISQLEEKRNKQTDANRVSMYNSLIAIAQRYKDSKEEYLHVSEEIMLKENIKAQYEGMKFVVQQIKGDVNDR